MTLLKPSIAIFSDLHLHNDSKDSRHALFIKALEHAKNKGVQEIWLLGDIFDMMLGKFSFWKKIHTDIFSTLSALQKSGIKIMWLEGNHDFYIQHLKEEFGFDILDGEQKLERQGVKIYCAHGDLVNAEDTAYLKWRGTTRSAKFRSLIDKFPEFFARYFALPFAENRSRSSRSKVYQITPDELRDLYRNFAKKKFQEGFSAVFMGHCHMQDYFHKTTGFYLNLGSWIEAEKTQQAPFALWNPQDPQVRILNAYQL